MNVRRFTSRLNQTIIDPIRRGHPGEAVDFIKGRFQSETYYWGLKRDLSVPFEASPAKITVTVRKAEARDVETIARTQVPTEERFELARRVEFLRNGVQTCYVAAAESDAPAYIQWLFGADANDLIQDNFHGLFPWLKDDEALLEYAYTMPDFRGQRVMPYAMDLIARKGEDIGARYVITFVGNYNVAALKGCERAGFAPYVLVRDSWRGFRRTITFLEIDQGPPYPLHQQT